MIRFLCLVVVLLSSCSVAVAQDESLKRIATAVLRKTDDQVNVLRDKQTQIERDLKRMRKGHISKRVAEMVIPEDEKKVVLFPSKTAKTQAIDSHEAYLESLQRLAQNYSSRRRLFYGTFKIPPKQGDLGQIEGTSRVNVQQVLGPDSMLVRATYAVETYGAISSGNRETMVRDVKIKGVLLIVKGVSTEGVADGEGFDLTQVFEVRGTSTHDTVLGDSRTVVVLNAIDTDKLEAYIEASGK